MTDHENYMKGTTGELDYLVVATSINNLRLGIKSFSIPGYKGGYLVGIRVRTARISNAPVEDTKMFLNAWPFMFQKVDKHRASCELVQIINQSPAQMNKIIRHQDVLAGEAFDYLEGVGLAVERTRKEVIDHITKGWFDPIKNTFGPEKVKFLFSTFVTLEAMKKNAPKDLTVELSGLKLAGKPTVWPKVGNGLDDILNGGAGKDNGDDTTDNVVSLTPKTNKKTPPEKSSE